MLLLVAFAVLVVKIPLFCLLKHHCSTIVVLLYALNLPSPGSINERVKFEKWWGRAKLFAKTKNGGDIRSPLTVISLAWAIISSIVGVVLRFT